MTFCCFSGRMAVNPTACGIAAALVALNLGAFRDRLRADLDAGRLAFEAKHRAEIRELTLSPKELQALKPTTAQVRGGRP